MRKINCFLLILVLTLSLSLPAFGAQRSIFTTPTGYTSAGDVEYITYSGTVKVTASTSYTVEDVIVNWGARGEDATFLTTYAESYYTGDYTWDALSALSGGTGTADAYNSDLYDALQTMMKANHAKETSYNETRAYYAFTDCIGSDYSQISSFYSGKTLTGTWDSGKTWNREHTWPNSKGLGGNDENDIMMLRPTATSENGSRGNKAYGESSGYFDPGVDTRGDCARIVLYTYVRWGNTGKMWGTSGVMESLDVLLRWMEEDPVDTWEMGRNDAVQSITGVRNVFVDYPEYAWLLFGQEVPKNMVTPSGEAMAEDPPACTHENTELRNTLASTCTESGYTGDSYCTDCGQQISVGTEIPANGHQNTEVRNTAEPTCTADGYTGDQYCLDCGERLIVGVSVPATGNHTLDENHCCIHCDYVETEYTECTHKNVEHRGQKEATCADEGHTGDVYCADCGDFIAGGSVIPATEHQFSEWITAPGGGSQSRWCSVCNYEETEPSTAPNPAPPLNWSAIVIVAVVVIVLAGGIIAIVIIKKKQA